MTKRDKRKKILFFSNLMILIRCSMCFNEYTALQIWITVVFINYDWENIVNVQIFSFTITALNVIFM